MLTFKELHSIHIPFRYLEPLAQNDSLVNQLPKYKSWKNILNPDKVIKSRKVVQMFSINIDVQIYICKTSWRAKKFQVSEFLDLSLTFFFFFFPGVISVPEATGFMGLFWCMYGVKNTGAVAEWIFAS